jgi:hypothetical protein
MKCTKRAFANKLEANTQILLHWKNDPNVRVIRAYMCQGHWHLTSQDMNGH